VRPTRFELSHQQENNEASGNTICLSHIKCQHFHSRAREHAPSPTGLSTLDRIVTFELAIQRREVYAEDVGGARLVLIDGREGLKDVAALDLFERGA
jgi:hypothetical protein